MNPVPVIHDHPGIALAQMVRVGRVEGKINGATALKPPVFSRESTHHSPEREQVENNSLSA